MGPTGLPFVQLELHDQSWVSIIRVMELHNYELRSSIYETDFMERHKSINCFMNYETLKNNYGTHDSCRIIELHNWINELWSIIIVFFPLWHFIWTRHPGAINRYLNDINDMFTGHDRHISSKSAIYNMCNFVIEKKFLRGKEFHFCWIKILIIMKALKGHVKFLKTVCVSPNKDLHIS